MPTTSSPRFLISVMLLSVAAAGDAETGLPEAAAAGEAEAATDEAAGDPGLALAEDGRGAAPEAALPQAESRSTAPVRKLTREIDFILAPS
ncbi:MAG: hypothetical protein ACYDAG_07645 [Chloroflexota bacterium]